MAHSDSIPRSEPEFYAEAVANDVLAGKTGKVRHGSNVWKTKVGQILPTSVQVRDNKPVIVYRSNGVLTQDRISCEGACFEELG